MWILTNIVGAYVTFGLFFAENNFQKHDMLTGGNLKNRSPMRPQQDILENASNEVLHY